MIGIFDSGIGGLSVVRELIRRHADVDFLYLGDTARTPYGNKSPETIIRYALEDAGYLISKGATHIIAACNTVSSVAMPKLREAYPDIVFFDVVTPAVHAAQALQTPSQKGKRVGVIGTRATIESGIYETQLKAADDAIEVISESCPLFVPLVEEGWTKYPETKKIVRRYLSRIRRRQVDALILGCTHYPFLLDVIRMSLQKRVRIIDSPSAVIHALEKDAPDILAHGTGKHVYAFTDPSEHIHRISERWLNAPINIEMAELKIPT